ncbi:MAG: helix-turn-helix domain-containing protein [Pseudomonadota bacterium]
MRRIVLTPFPERPRATSLESLGTFIRAQRTASGLKLRDAALLCGVSKDVLTRVENGAGPVGSDNLLQILDTLGLTLLVVPKNQASQAEHAVAAARDISE